MENDLKSKIELIKQYIKSYEDFPKKGVVFRDVFSVLREPKASAALRDILVQLAKSISNEVECVIGLDARGFLFGPLLALELGVPFVAVRKRGKLPGEVISQTYSLEYGQDTLEVQTESISKGMKVLIVDDLLATGGSLKAACELMKKGGASVVGCLVVVELVALKGRASIPAAVQSVVQY